MINVQGFCLNDGNVSRNLGIWMLDVGLRLTDDKPKPFWNDLLCFGLDEDFATVEGDATVMLLTYLPGEGARFGM